MILKMSHMNKDTGRIEWSWIDNILQASSGYDPIEDCKILVIQPKGVSETSAFPIRGAMYLCNDDGKTIEAFYPDIKKGE
jgi:hypothetical protein